MNYYVLRIDKLGELTAANLAASKHMIKASCLAEALGEADRIVTEGYEIDDISFLKMFDETGLVAARDPQGGWRH